MKLNTNTYKSENEYDLIVSNIRIGSLTPYEFFTAWYGALARTTAKALTTTPENNDLIDNPFLKMKSICFQINLWFRWDELVGH